LQLLVSALWGGYTASNVLKWYWWRFNSQGFFWGMLSGIIVAGLPMIFSGLLPALFPDLAADIRILYYFPIIVAISLIGCIAATYLTKPTDEETLKQFYRQVKPWGFWKPIHDKVVAENPNFEKNKNFKRDMMNVLIGTIWQTSLVALPMFIVFHEFVYAIITGIICVVLSIVLKKTWWDNLHEMDKDYIPNTETD
jgi:hypothetical protein